MSQGRKLSSFSVLLVMVALMIVGAAMIPLLSIHYTPVEKPNSLSISFSWYNAPARLVEQEVTSKIEGAVARMDGISGMSSVSHKGSGVVYIDFKKNINMETARFETASIIRYLYPKFPEGVSYPDISVSSSGSNASAILGYTINSALPPKMIGEYLDMHVLPKLSSLDGVSGIDVGGITPFGYEITFDPVKTMVYGISADQISAAFNNYFREDPVGYVQLKEGNTVLLKIASPGDNDFGGIPVGLSGDKVVYLRDVAKVEYVESLPSSYFRINGLNTVNLNIFAEEGSNIITLGTTVKNRVKELEDKFPEGMSAILNYDASEYVKNELNKIVVRTSMTLAILLLFVLVVSRKWNYFFVICSTMLANILLAVIFYYLLKVDIHIYSLAGFTVSLGIIIDTSIIMADHYSYYRDRRAFTSIFGAVLTTIAALTVIFFLPENQKLILKDFAVVIIVNLGVSLLVSLLFIPSFIDKFPSGKGITRFSRRHCRRIVRFNRLYGRYILFIKRYKWAYIIILVLAFGIPLNLLPDKIKPTGGEEAGKWQKVYNSTFGSNFYQENKQVFEKIFGGSMRLFTVKNAGSSFFRDAARQVLTIRAGMPEGCTVQQLNEVVIFMENFLSKFDQVDMFRTNIWSHDNSSIEVTFKPEYENTAFPAMLKREIISAANNYGGATWSVYGIDDQSFNNNVHSSYKSHRIILTGYNYDRLVRYASELADTLALNRRVSDPGVYAQVSWYVPQNEFTMDFDRQKVAMAGIDMNGYFNYLGQLLYNQSLGQVYLDGKYEYISLASSDKNSFDLWNVKNNPLTVDSLLIKFSDIGEIIKRPTGLDIFKRNQTYEVCVAFDFIGSYELSNRLIKSQVERLNENVLPIGFKASEQWWGGWGKDGKKQILLILLIILIIFFVCSIIFESLLKPLVIIVIIPVSFIGIFLLFGLTGIRYDQGGFAAFIFLSGIVVNAGIYIINEFNIIKARKTLSPMNVYLKAYNRKIIPILLTILSSMLGLLPFLYKGEEDVFWYAFATGTMSGLAVSLVVLIFIMPLFMPLKPGKKKTERLNRQAKGC